MKSRKEKIRKPLMVFLLMVVLALCYELTGSHSKQDGQIISRDKGGSNKYRVTWGEDCFDMAVEYKKMQQPGEEEELLKEEATPREMLKSYISKLERQSRETETFELPDSYQGKPIVWEKKRDGTPFALVALGLFAAILVYKEQDQELRKQEQKRREQLTRQYPQLVGSLTTLLDSGMSLRYAIGRLTIEHLGGDGPLQKELETLLRRLQSGAGMNEALWEFASGCDVRQYRKLVSLLLQNQEQGSRGLKQMLHAEVEESEQSRLQLARQDGEKAQTRMLLPLTLLLGLVMVILMVPAWMQMNQM